MAYSKKGCFRKRTPRHVAVGAFLKHPLLCSMRLCACAHCGRLSKYQYKGQHADHDRCRAKRNACLVVATAPKVERDKETDRWRKPQQLGEQVEQKTHNAILACAEGLCTEQEERARK